MNCLSPFCEGILGPSYNLDDTLQPLPERSQLNFSHPNMLMLTSSAQTYICAFLWAGGSYLLSDNDEIKQLFKKESQHLVCSFNNLKEYPLHGWIHARRQADERRGWRGSGWGPRPARRRVGGRASPLQHGHSHLQGRPQMASPTPWT